MSSDSKYFFPVVEKGLRKYIGKTDNMGSGEDDGARVRPEFSIQTHYSYARFDKVAKEVDTGHLTQGTAIENVFQLAGPGDVKSVSRDAVLKVYPADGSEGLAPTYHPYVEFYDPDFPWRFSPAKIAGKTDVINPELLKNPEKIDIRLRPWISLIVCRKEFCTLKDDRKGGHTVTFHLEDDNAYRSVFPDPQEVWKQAHAEGTGMKDAILSRVMAVRRGAEQLDAFTSYCAFLLPTFEIGRLHGLGIEGDAVDKNTPLQLPSWADTLEEQSNRKKPLDFPVYLSWSFTTGDASFDVLVDRLHPAGMPSKTGLKIDVTHMGNGLDYSLSGSSAKRSITLPAAARALNTSVERTFPYREDSAEEPFYKNMTALLSRSPVFTENRQDKAAPGQTDAASEEDPVVTPPVYGARHVLADNLEDGNYPWLQDLNLDVHYRAVAGLGRKMVQTHQEEFVARAWNMAGMVQALNVELYNRLASIHANRSVNGMTVDRFDKHFLANFMRGLRTVINMEVPAEASGNLQLSLKKLLEDKRIPVSFASAGFQNLTDELAKSVAAIDTDTVMEEIAEHQVFRIEDPVMWNLPDISQLEHFRDRLLKETFTSCAQKFSEIAWTFDHAFNALFPGQPKLFETHLNPDANEREKIMGKYIDFVKEKPDILSELSENLSSPSDRLGDEVRGSIDNLFYAQVKQGRFVFGSELKHSNLLQGALKVFSSTSIKREDNWFKQLFIYDNKKFKDLSKSLMWGDNDSEFGLIGTASENPFNNEDPKSVSCQLSFGDATVNLVKEIPIPDGSPLNVVGLSSATFVELFGLDELVVRVGDYYFVNTVDLLEVCRRKPSDYRRFVRFYHTMLGPEGSGSFVVHDAYSVDRNNIKFSSGVVEHYRDKELEAYRKHLESTGMSKKNIKFFMESMEEHMTREYWKDESIYHLHLTDTEILNPIIIAAFADNQINYDFVRSFNRRYLPVDSWEKDGVTVYEYYVTLPWEKRYKANDQTINWMKSVRPEDYVVINSKEIKSWSKFRSYDSLGEFIVKNSSPGGVYLSRLAYLVENIQELRTIREEMKTKEEKPIADVSQQEEYRNSFSRRPTEAENRMKSIAENYYSHFLADERMQDTYLNELLQSKYPIMAYPFYPEPSYYYLREFSEKFILPSADEMGEDTVSMFTNDPAFEEAFLAGMNTEMGRELLWREYPTDKRGSYFRKFWDSCANTEDMVKDRYYDIKPLHTWSGTTLGKNHKEGKENLLILTVKGKLMRLYPSTQVYLTKAVYSGGKYVPGEETLLPSMSCFLRDDIYMLGFEISLKDAIGRPKDAGNCGYFLTFKEDVVDLDFEKPEKVAEYANSAALAADWVNDPSVVFFHLATYLPALKKN